MKTISAVLWLLMIVSSVLVGQERSEKVEKILDLAARNLEVTLKQGNDNLRESAIVVVSELSREFPGIDLNNTVIPLMSILRSHAQPGMRILAAMTLRELKNDEAMFALQEAARFDSNQTVRHICQTLGHVKR
jgi:hypothetical protein